MKNNRGQILIELCGTMFAQLLIASLVSLALFWVFCIAFVHVEAYSLARASLYGSKVPCQPSKHWPKLEKLNIEYRCTKPSGVKAKLSLGTYIQYETLINLRTSP